MYSIKKVHDYIYFLANKQKEVFFSHEEVDQMLDMYQMGLFDKLKGRPEANKGMVNPVSGKGAKKWYDDALNPFREKKAFLESETSDGLLKLPKDYAKLNSLYTQSYNNTSQRIEYKEIEVIKEDMLPRRLNSSIVGPKMCNPCAEWIGVDKNNQYILQLYPKKPMSGYLTYLTRPVEPKYDYSMNGRTEQFNPSGSVDLQWNDECQLRIILSTLEALGINTNDKSLIQISELKQTEGITA